MELAKSNETVADWPDESNLWRCRRREKAAALISRPTRACADYVEIN